MRSALVPLLLTCLLLASGCASSLPSVWITDLPLQRKVVRILPGDEIEILVKDQQKLSGKFPVRQNGTLAIPIVGELPVAGLTEQEAAQALSRSLEGIVVEPLVTLSISKRKPISVPVLGEVKNVGVQTIQLGDGMLELLANVSGLTDFASKTGIYVIRREPKLIRIRFDYDALIGGERKHVEFELEEGDVVVVE